MASRCVAVGLATVAKWPANRRFWPAFAILVGCNLAGCERVEELAAATAVAIPAASAASATSQSARLEPQQIAGWYDSLAGAPDQAACGGALSQLGQTNPADPDRAVLAYLGGEICLKSGQPMQALEAFSSAASETAAAGVSGLAAVALWRWLQILDALDRPAVEQVERVLAQGERLQSTAVFESMVRSGLLPALPLLEEDIARRLAAVARKAGRPEANDLLLAFINIDSSGVLLAPEQAQVAKMVAGGVISQMRLDLFTYRRQLSMVQTKSRRDKVAARLQRLWNDEQAPSMVRAEAAYEWGNYMRRSADEAIEALGAAYSLAGGKGPVAGRALYGRAMVYNNKTPHADLFFRDMKQFIEEFPHSRLLDDALYQIGSEQLLGDEPRPQDAFKTFESLRAITKNNDWADSAYFVPAFGHVVRGNAGDLEAADKLLKEYLLHNPEGVFRYRCLFWRGRIAEMHDDQKAARTLFKQLAKEAPFDYYGLRARLHMHQGTAAVNRSLPAGDSAIFAELHAAYRDSTVPSGPPTADSPLLHRVRTAKDSGLYVRLLGQFDGLGRNYRNRLDNVPLKDLDRDGVLPMVALLLAWRQDAFRARYADPSAVAVLRLSSLLGHGLNDWPVAMQLLAVPASAPRSDLAALQQDQSYLAVAYPGTRELSFLRDPLDASAWPINESLALGKSLMYAVIRQESAFLPSAISGAGALGLFQIMPNTFETVDARCRSGADPRKPAAFLFNPGLNAGFWSCWVQHEFKPEGRDELALMLVKHHAGSGNLARWRNRWKGSPVENDLEMQVESMRFTATQSFVRKVLSDVAIVEAAGIFDGVSAEGGRK